MNNLAAAHRCGTTTTTSGRRSCCPLRPQRASAPSAAVAAPHVRNHIRSVACGSTASPDAPGPSPQLTSQQEVEEVWQQLTLIKRKLSVAVSQEDFPQAAALRDQANALSARLPPVQQFLFSQLERLRGGSVEERRAAIASLGAAGDDACLPDLALCLRDPALQDAAHAAMWAIFTRCRDPRVNELMAEGEPLLHGGTQPQLERALGVYSEVVRLAPSFAEGYNKRATVLYLLHRHREALQDCAMVLDLNPHHFGAASGMGLCHWQLKQHQEALKAFERAVGIHPGLVAIRGHIEALREEVARAAQRAREDSDG